MFQSFRIITTLLCISIVGQTSAKQTDGGRMFERPGVIMSEPAPAGDGHLGGGRHFHNDISLFDQDGILKYEYWVSGAAQGTVVNLKNCPRVATFKDPTKNELVRFIVTDCGNPAAKGVWILIHKNPVPGGGEITIDVPSDKPAGEVIGGAFSGFTGKDGQPLNTDDFEVVNGRLKSKKPILVPKFGGELQIVVDPLGDYYYYHFVFPPTDVVNSWFSWIQYVILGIFVLLALFVWRRRSSLAR